MRFHGKSGEYCISLCVTIRSLVAELKIRTVVLVREAKERSTMKEKMSTMNQWGWEVEVQATFCYFDVVCVEVANRHTDLLSFRGVDTKRPPFSSASYGCGIGGWAWRVSISVDNPRRRGGESMGQSVHEGVISATMSMSTSVKERRQEHTIANQKRGHPSQRAQHSTKKEATGDTTIAKVPILDARYICKRVRGSETGAWF